jgi:nanoRNase/pAp phosphatase (c-di-AMP/oligoRNAs hydrolase)
VRIVSGGVLGRAENRAMVRLCRIRVTLSERARLRDAEGTVLVDTQPWTGNSFFPEGRIPTAVIDHHPRRRGTKGEFVDIRPEIGATASIVAAYLAEARVEPGPAAASALLFGIESEAFGFARTPHPLDLAAHRGLAPAANRNLLARIGNPPLPPDYFIALAHSLERTFVYRNAVVTVLEELSDPDFVPQFADLFLRLRRATWSCCVAPWRSRIVFSIRSTGGRQGAGSVARRLSAPRGKAGGHDRIAGGWFPLEGGGSCHEQLFSTALRFLLLLGHRDVQEIRALVSPENLLAPFVRQAQS